MEGIKNLIPFFIVIVIASIIQISANRIAKKKITKFISDIRGELIFAEWTFIGEPRWASWGKMFRSDYNFAFKMNGVLHNGYMISWLDKHKTEWMIDGKWVDDPVKLFKKNNLKLARRPLRYISS